VSPYGIVAKLVVVSVAAAVSSCFWARHDEKGFSIFLVDSGEVVIADEHVSAYIMDTYRFVLSPKGIERWESFARFDTLQEPPVRKLGGLTGKQFVLSIDGVEIYRGHFWSLVMSRMQSGILIYDTLGPAAGEIWVGFEPLNQESKEDPRDRQEIVGYFRKQGKLK